MMNLLNNNGIRATAVLLASLFLAACQPGYRPLDKTFPVVFCGDRFVFGGDTVVLSEKAFYVDATLTEESAAQSPFVFTSFNEAMAHLTPGTEQDPMRVYVAPYVYWIDDPDDPAERVPAGGGTPYGLEVSCAWLHLYGLTKNPENVVLACNRGQTQGADGNFTMFHFTGDGFYASYITFGNYCNVDLEYPLKPRLNRRKRFDAITQAQLAMMNGDRIMAEHCRFISRLNLCPLLGGNRTFYYDCHFESTDDALTGSAVYLGCDFDFYSSKPFGAAGGQGAVLLDCRFNLKGSSVQYLTKMGGQVAIVDGRFLHPTGDVFIGWTETPSPSLRCYQYGVTLNGKPYVMHDTHEGVTVDMTGKPLLGAYRLDWEGDVFYNTYNLLRGRDDWDPMHVRELVEKASARDGRDYASMATSLSMTASAGMLETGGTDAYFSTRSQVMNRQPAGSGWGGFGMQPVLQPASQPASQPGMTWLLTAKPEGNDSTDGLAVLTEDEDGTVRVTSVNEGETRATVYVRAVTPEGLEAASALTMVPPMLPAPGFTAFPTLSDPENGLLTVNYTLDLQGRDDQSLVTWYRIYMESGTTVPVAVSRENRPYTTYRLQPGDAGCRIMVEVAPKHIRSVAGASRRVVSASSVKPEDIVPDIPENSLQMADKVLPESTLSMVATNRFFTDFVNFPDDDQRTVRKGCWTLDTYKPADITKYNWQAALTQGWVYGAGEGGAVGEGFLQRTKGARMLYTPMEDASGDMYVRLKVDPCKSAGQGFGSATAQYMDVYIKFDTETLTGYALRIIRTVKFANAVDFVLMKYENGQTKEISKAVSASCFRTGCSIVLGMAGNQLKAHVETETPLTPHTSPDVVQVVDLAAEVEPSTAGGTGVQHTGSTGASATMFHEFEVVWF